MKFKLSAVLVSLLLLTACSSENKTTDPSPSPVVSPSPTAFRSVGDLKVHFIDVGQGDSILVQTPGGKTMLVDAGKKEDGNKVVDYIKSQGIQKIDALVNTYPADDHIGGMTQVANSFDIGSVYIPRKSVDSPSQKDFLKVEKIKKMEKNEAAPGTQIPIDPSVTIDVLAPNSYTYSDLKDFSAVLKVTYGDNSFLLTGDATGTSEKDIISKGYNLRSTVLKVANHGSKNSTTDDFFNAVAPKYAVISIGKGKNPAKEVTDKLNLAAVQTYRTDEKGTVVATTDGLTIKFDTVASK
jgi:competence protein ComEC